MATLIQGDLQFDGHVGIGRPPTEVPLHVSQTVVANGSNTCTVQIDKIVAGGQGGVHVGLKVQTIALPGWDSDDGQLFGLTSESEIACPGTGEAWGGQDHARVLIGADPGNEACGREIDVVTEVPVNTRTGMIIGAMPYSQRPTHQGHRATGLDTVMLVVNKKYAAQWKAGITFSQPDPTTTLFPIAPDGVLITATAAVFTSVKNGIDFSALAFTGDSIKVPGFSVNGAGKVTITSNIAKMVLDDTAGKSYSVRSSGGAWNVRDETIGTDRLRIDAQGKLCLWPDADVVTESVTSNRTVSVEIKGVTYKLCLKA